MSKDEYERIILEKHKDNLYFDSQICKEAALADIGKEKIKWFLDPTIPYNPLMEAISKQKAIQILIQKNISLLDISTAQKIFSFKKENSLYKFLQRLERADILKRIIKGKYLFSKRSNKYLFL